MGKHVPVYVRREDKSFLWDWACALRDKADLLVGPQHFFRVLLEDLYQMAAEQTLFDTISEFEARVIQAAIDEEKEATITNRFAYPELVESWNERIARPLGLPLQPMPTKAPRTSVQREQLRAKTSGPSARRQRVPDMPDDKPRVLALDPDGNTVEEREKEKLALADADVA